jgi:hypothetical protein
MYCLQMNKVEMNLLSPTHIFVVILYCASYIGAEMCETQLSHHTSLAPRTSLILFNLICHALATLITRRPYMALIGWLYKD